MIFDKERNIKLTFNNKEKYYKNHNNIYYYDSIRDKFLLFEEQIDIFYDKKTDKNYEVKEEYYYDYKGNKFRYDFKTKKFISIPLKFKKNIIKDESKCKFLKYNYQSICGRLRTEIGLTLDKADSLSYIGKLYKELYSNGVIESIKYMNIEEINNYHLSIKYYNYIIHGCYNNRNLFTKLDCPIPDESHEFATDFFKNISVNTFKIKQIAKERIKQLDKEEKKRFEEENKRTEEDKKRNEEINKKYQ